MKNFGNKAHPVLLTLATILESIAILSGIVIAVGFSGIGAFFFADTQYAIDHTHEIFFKAAAYTSLILSGVPTLCLILQWIFMKKKPLAAVIISAIGVAYLPALLLLLPYVM